MGDPIASTGVGPEHWTPREYQRALEIRARGKLPSSMAVELEAGIAKHESMYPDRAKDAQPEGPQTSSPEYLAAAASATSPAQAYLDQLSSQRQEPMAQWEPPITPTDTIKAELPQAMTFGAGDELGAKMAVTQSSPKIDRSSAPALAAFFGMQLPKSLQPEKPGHESRTEDIPRTYAPGQSAEESTRQAIEEPALKASAANPKTALATDIIGGGIAALPMTLATGGATAPAIGTRMLTGGLGAGGLSAAESAARAQPGNRTEQGAWGGLAGLITGGLAGMLPMNKAAAKAGQMADEERGLSTGITSDEAGKLAADKYKTTRPALQQLGRDVEEQGLSKSSKVNPLSADARRMEVNADKAAKQAGQILGNVKETMGTRVNVDLSDAAQYLTDEAKRLKTWRDPEAEEVAIGMLRRAKMMVTGETDEAALHAYEDTAARAGVAAKKAKTAKESTGGGKHLNIQDWAKAQEEAETAVAASRRASSEAGEAAAAAQPPKRNPTYKEVLGHRQFLDDLAFKAKGQVDSPAADRYRALAGKLREAMLESLGDVSPATRQTVERANKAYETAMRVRGYSGGETQRQLTANVTPGDMWSLGSARLANRFGPAAKADFLRSFQQSGLTALPGVLGNAASTLVPEDEDGIRRYK